MRLDVTAFTEVELGGEHYGIHAPSLFTTAEVAGELSRLLKAASRDGRLAVVLSDLPNYGRSGIAYAVDNRAVSPYYPTRDEDTMEKIVNRLIELTRLRTSRADLPSLLAAVAEGSDPNEYGCWQVVFRQQGGRSGESLVTVAALSEAEAIEFAATSLPHFWPQPDGTFFFNGRLYETVATCLKEPEVQTTSNRVVQPLNPKGYGAYQQVSFLG